MDSKHRKTTCIYSSLLMLSKWLKTIKCTPPISDKRFANLEEYRGESIMMFSGFLSWRVFSKAQWKMDTFFILCKKNLCVSKNASFSLSTKTKSKNENEIYKSSLSFPGKKVGCLPAEFFHWIRGTLPGGSTEWTNQLLMIGRKKWWRFRFVSLLWFNDFGQNLNMALRSGKFRLFNGIVVSLCL